MDLLSTEDFVCDKKFRIKIKGSFTLFHKKINKVNLIFIDLYLFFTYQN